MGAVFVVGNSKVPNMEVRKSLKWEVLVKTWLGEARRLRLNRALLVPLVLVALPLVPLPLLPTVNTAV